MLPSGLTLRHVLVVGVDGVRFDLPHTGGREGGARGPTPQVVPAGRTPRGTKRRALPGQGVAVQGCHRADRDQGGGQARLAQAILDIGGQDGEAADEAGGGVGAGAGGGVGVAVDDGGESAPRPVWRTWNSRTAGARAGPRRSRTGARWPRRSGTGRRCGRRRWRRRKPAPGLAIGVKRSVSSYRISGWVRLCRLVTSTLDEATPSRHGAAVDRPRTRPGRYRWRR